jgi:two-component system, NarL family, response regulator NreC
MEKPSTIVIAEDHTILRESLVSLLSCQVDLKVVGEAGDGLEAIRCVQDHSPDMILLDISMPRMSGLEAIREIKRIYPKTKILVLTVHKEEVYIFSVLKAGADGYIVKESDSAELLMAIRQVLNGHRYLSPGISGMIIDGFLEGKKMAPVRSPWETLTQRERQILKLIGKSHKNREIADLLRISVKTVEKHRANLIRKLGMSNIAALTALAAAKGLINE